MKKSNNLYIAGLFDGEGTVTLTKSSKNDKFKIPVASVSSTSYELLKFLQDNYGGSISKQKIYKENHKQSWSWKLSYQKALFFFKNIFQYILENNKRYIINILLKEYNKLTNRNGKYTKEQETLKLLFEDKFFHPENNHD